MSKRKKSNSIFTGNIIVDFFIAMLALPFYMIKLFFECMIAIAPVVAHVIWKVLCFIVKAILYLSVFLFKSLGWLAQSIALVVMTIYCKIKKADTCSAIQSIKDNRINPFDISPIMASAPLDGSNDTGIVVTTGEDYERYCGAKLSKLGYRNIQYTPQSGDYGADIIAISPKGERVCFQCKYYSANVGIGAVQEVHSAMSYYNCIRGAVLTNSNCTKSAHELANRSSIMIYERF